MAMCVRYACGECGKSIEAWDEGNPYYYDDSGTKQYAYHPDHERLSLCIGNDVPHICLSCGAEFVVDSQKAIENCPMCSSSEVCDTLKLEGMRCPWCKSGNLGADMDFHVVS